MVHIRDERLNAEGPTPVPKKRGRPALTARAMNAHEEDRSDPADQDVREDTDSLEEMTDDERFDFFVQSYDNSILPDLPPMPGFHVCWLTTTNPRDPIARRIRMGYTPIRVEDLGPGWQGVGLKTGDYAGVVGINEMIAAKIPLSLYQRYMRELHHTRPLGDEEKLRANIDMAKERASEYGGRLHEGDGMAELVKRAPMPSFAG